MASRVTSEFPRPRTLIHPGPFNPIRIQSRHSARARHVRLALQPGCTLFDALVRPLAGIGMEYASTTILGGFFEQLHFCVAPQDPSGQAVIAYTRPEAAGRSSMVFGNATIGKDADGSPLVHCHAAIRTEGGQTRGGHVIAQASVIGPNPIAVLVTSLDSFELRVAFDPETNIALMQPAGVVGHD
jgi:predicted DNA-binding protein with PD1-like motif